MLEEKDLQRMKIFKEYEDGNVIGEINGIKNVNSKIWIDFKRVARLHGNSEGAALTACVQAWLSNPVNYVKIEEMKQSEASHKPGEPDEN